MMQKADPMRCMKRCEHQLPVGADGVMAARLPSDTSQVSFLLLRSGDDARMHGDIHHSSTVSYGESRRCCHLKRPKVVYIR